MASEFSAICTRRSCSSIAEEICRNIIGRNCRKHSETSFIGSLTAKHSNGTIRNLWNTIGRRFNAFPRCPKRLPAWASGESSANMKIRCGSHQQNRSIVRPGLSLMATKVALTAEEFRENSQRSIALFNTEKLSTDSTHVRKKCILQFCAFLPLQSARGVWRQRLA